MKTFQQNKKNEQVKNVFNQVFDKYDLMNDLMSAGMHRIWKKQFINCLNPQKKTKLVDVASGTGDITQLYLDAISDDGQVYCVDSNKEMLNASQKKIKKNGKIKWICGNAEKLPLKNNLFDYYTIGFGIRNVSNIDRSLSEAYRVLKPGGRFLCLEFSKVKNDVLNKFYQFYSKSIPIIGAFIVGNSEPYKYLVKSIKDFYTQEELLKKIKKNGFTKTSYRNLSGGIVAIHSAWKI